ncbi:hypothetical protein ID866_4159 [Astraeus odoratus]|nr:hypothetical protein ID866_4159 [Astraeus odoratus]
MMRLLHWVLSGRTSEYNLGEFPVEWGAPPAGVKEAGWGLFSVLYSDIGGEFYKNCGPGLAKSGGWETRDPISTMWEVRHEPLTSLNSRDWAWLKHSDLDRLWAKDAAQIKRVIANMPIPTARAIVSFLPDGGVGSSHIFRSMLAAESIISVENWGVVKDDKNTDKPTYATWTVDVRPPPPTLIVTRISATEETFSDLVEAIQHTCRGNGISRMEVWNLPECLMEMAAQMGGKTFQRHEHLPAIKWYGRGNTTDVKWVFNEKYVKYDGLSHPY